MTVQKRTRNVHSKQTLRLIMEKELKVAFIGIRPGKLDSTQFNKGFNDYGMRLYRLSIEQVITIVERVQQGILDDAEFGLTPEVSENILYGSREYPVYYNDKTATELVKDVDVFIIATGVGILWGLSVFGWLRECLEKSCTIVLRLPFEGEDLVDKHYGSVQAENWCKELNLVTRHSKWRLWPRSNSNYHNEIFLIGSPALGGVHQDESIPLLRTSLLKDQAIKDAVKPIKETVGIFHSITNWLNKVTH